MNVIDLSKPKYTEAQLDSEWIFLCTTREMMWIAEETDMAPTYRRSLRTAKELAPEIYHHNILEGSEPKDVRYYRQLAEAESATSGKNVTPMELVEKEISKNERLAKTSDTESQLLKDKADSLSKIKVYFADELKTENQLIWKDSSIGDKIWPLIKLHDEQIVKEYKISDDKGLRVLVLHPDKGEPILGADLIYEIYDRDREKVRMVFLQYKIWDKRTLYFSEHKGLEEQLKKMHKYLCKEGFCDKIELNDKAYRFRPCCAFLRPTDKLQGSDSRMVSSGLHLPICRIDSLCRVSDKGNKILDYDSIRRESVSQRVFQELFLIGSLGSDWINREKADDLLAQIKFPNHRVTMIAQHFELESGA
jgi:hypothetical protein